MASSMGVNVLRWGAGVFGIFYGFTHQQAIFTREKVAANQHEYDRKAKLIDEAKAKFAEKNSPKQGDGVIMDVNDSKFDLEAYLNKLSKENP